MIVLPELNKDPHKLEEICAGFDSVYVSFYKGVGALAGAMLLGDAGFVAEAALWQRRMGGTLYTQVASVVTAARSIQPERRSTRNQPSSFFGWKRSGERFPSSLRSYCAQVRPRSGETMNPVW